METEPEAAPVFICAWCQPSDVPEREPEICRVMFCEKHRRVWHYPEGVKLKGPPNRYTTPAHAQAAQEFDRDAKA